MADQCRHRPPPRPQRTLDHLSHDGLAVSIIAVAEVYEGAFGTQDPQATLAGLRDFLSDFAILPLTDPIVEHFARIRAALRQQGQLIPDMDLLIAATALQEDLTLVTRNVRHFERINRLRLDQPSRLEGSRLRAQCVKSVIPRLGMTQLALAALASCSIEPASRWPRWSRLTT